MWKKPLSLGAGTAEDVCIEISPAFDLNSVNPTILSSKSPPSKACFVLSSNSISGECIVIIDWSTKNALLLVALSCFASIFALEKDTEIIFWISAPLSLPDFNRSRWANDTVDPFSISVRLSVLSDIGLKNQEDWANGVLETLSLIENTVGHNIPWANTILS